MGVVAVLMQLVDVQCEGARGAIMRLAVEVVVEG